VTALTDIPKFKQGCRTDMARLVMEVYPVREAKPEDQRELI
jgi:hypothetical protein